jgi:hypothetical protein
MGGITVDYTGCNAHLICCKWKKIVKSGRKIGRVHKKKRCEKEESERKHRKGEEQW